MDFSALVELWNQSYFSDIAALLLGLVFGSFLNVCICRIPLSESIVFPSSHCPHCGKEIPFYDNIPVVSFLLLRGRCRQCHAAISWQYPLVESLTALVFWLTCRQVGWSLRGTLYLVFFSAMLVLVFIDLYHRILPDRITLTGIVAGIAASLLVPVSDGTARFFLILSGYLHPSEMLLSVLDSLIGALVCGGFLWGVAEAYYRFRQVEGLGFGDIKLMGMVGAFLGVKLAVLTIMLGSLMGTVVGIAYIKWAGKDARYELPFGSFLGIAAILSALYGRLLFGGYVRLFRGF